MLDKLTSADFEARLHETFQITVAGTALECTLVDVTLLGATPSPGESREPFSLIFEVPGDAPFPQGTYDIAHDEMGVLPLFIVPIGAEKHRLRYEAVFN